MTQSELEIMQIIAFTISMIAVAYTCKRCCTSSTQQYVNELETYIIDLESQLASERPEPSAPPLSPL